MPRISYVKGCYCNHNDAVIHIEDRGYQFADGVYEVIRIQNKLLQHHELHFIRLKKSLSTLGINFSITDKAFLIIINELIRQNRIVNGVLYIQISRGVAKRLHSFSQNLIPSLIMVIYPSHSKAKMELLTNNGVAVVTSQDLRWQRCDVKSISLLPNILAKQYAVSQGAFESWLYNADGFITEGSSSNSYIVTTGDVIVTHPSNHNILSGITRQIILELAKSLNITVQERPFSIEEALKAKEAFLTSTTLGIIPVVKIDDSTINDCKVGDITLNLLKNYNNFSIQNFKNS